MPRHHNFLQVAQHLFHHPVSEFVMALQANALAPWSTAYRQKLEITYLLSLASMVCRHSLDQFILITYQNALNADAEGRNVSGYFEDWPAAHSLQKPEEIAKKDQVTLHSFARMIAFKNYRLSFYDCNSIMARLNHGEFITNVLIDICTLIVVSLNTAELTTEAQWLTEAHRDDVHLKIEELIAALRMLVGNFAKPFSN